tara:strand:- start:97 stop:1254 length:1158 start_codon:yes stop_codon:yes gene_type:complete
MTDKELFEKVENKFLPEKSLKLERFNKTKFQKVLNEIRGPSSPGNVGAGVGSFLNRAAAAIPGTRGYRMRSAEARKQEALAKQEELKAQQSEKDLQGGGSKKMSDTTAKFYKSNPQFAAAYDLAKKGQTLSSEQQRLYNKILKQIDAIESGEVQKAGKQEAQKEIENKAGENRLKKLGRVAPQITKFLIDPKNKETKNLFIKYNLQSRTLGIPTEKEIVQLANNLTKTLQTNVTEINNFKKFIRSEPNLQDDGATLIKLLPSAPTKATKVTGTKKTIKLSPKTVQQFIQKDAKKKGRTVEDQLKEMVRQANKKYKVGNVVKGTGGGNFKIIDINNETGLITVRSTNDNRRSYKFAKNLVDVTERGSEQPELNLPESFDQVIKRYR